MSLLSYEWYIEYRKIKGMGLLIILSSYIQVNSCMLDEQVVNCSDNKFWRWSGVVKRMILNKKDDTNSRRM